MEQPITEEQVWNEEAAKLGVDPKESAPEPQEAIAPTEPQEIIEEVPQEVDPLDEIRAKFGRIDALEQQNAQLLHHVKTAEGRVASMQREFQLAKSAQQNVAPQDAPTQNAMSAASKNPEKWEQLKQDFPEWASAMEEYVSSKIGDRPEQSLSSQAMAEFVQGKVAEVEQTFTRRLEEARLEGKYEDWRETVNTPDFTAWFSMQKPEVQALAQSTQARDAVRMLDLFSETSKRAASEIKTERGARLAAAATSKPGHTPPPVTVDEMDPVAIWNHEAAKLERTRAQRGF